MGNSLQEQLLKAGLANKSQAQQAKKVLRQQQRIPAVDPVVQAVARAEAEKAARDRALNQQQALKQAAKARKALLRQFIEQNRLNVATADRAYNFVHGTQIKRLYVTAAQHEQLVAGRLAIAQAGERYWLVSAEAGRKIHDLAPESFVFIATATASDNDYADYAVPDDLIW